LLVVGVEVVVVLVGLVVVVVRVVLGFVVLEAGLDVLVGVVGVAEVVALPGRHWEYPFGVWLVGESDGRGGETYMDCKDVSERRERGPGMISYLEYVQVYPETHVVAPVHPFPPPILRSEI
jgi:hypothetical protein